MNVGDKISVKTEEADYTGTVMPEAQGYLILKLSNGYNIGINKKKVKETKAIEYYKETPHISPKIEQKKGLPKITILHTGGTIASKIDYVTGGVIARFEPEELLAMFPEIREIADIKSRLLSKMWSENMRFAHYNRMAEAVQEEIINGADGIIITHGTDTLHYTGAALSFILKDLPIPVILVGAQRSSDRPSSDAALNLISATKFIANTDFSDVGICMHATTSDEECVIMPGKNTRKNHSSRRDAFQTINEQPWAVIDNDKIALRPGYVKKDKKRKLTILPIKENLKIGLLPSHPNMWAVEVDSYEGFDGVVLEGTGLGQMPIIESDNYTKENVKILNSIKKLITDGTKVAITTQTISGILDLNVYSAGRELLETGVIGNYCKMTPETAYIKLAWVLSNYPDKIKEYFEKE